MNQVLIDGQLLFNIVIGVLLALVGFLGGWVLNNISETIKLLDQDVRSMPHNYVSKADHSHQLDEIKMGLQRILDKLDSKMDKN